MLAFNFRQASAMRHTANCSSPASRIRPFPDHLSRRRGCIEFLTAPCGFRAPRRADSYPGPRVLFQAGTADPARREAVPQGPTMNRLPTRPNSHGNRPAVPVAPRSTPRGDDPSERRHDRRRTALEHRAWLGWTEECIFRTVDARLLDIGPAGALVETDASLRVDQRMLLALTNGPPDGDVECSVVRITRGRRLRHRVHLAFTEPCPASLLAGAIEGLPR